MHKNLCALGLCVLPSLVTLLSADAFAQSCNEPGPPSCSDTIGATFSYQTIAGGDANTVNNTGATVGGGESNDVEGADCTISGGNGNKIYDETDSTICGGQLNVIGVSGGTSLGQKSTIAGGYSNSIDQACYAVFIGGGFGNEVTGTSSEFDTIGGGVDNAISGSSLYAFIGGGIGNSVSESGAVIAGGSTNTASGQFSAVTGGYDNLASGDYSTAGGYQSNATGYASVALGYKARAVHEGCIVLSDKSALSGCTQSNEFVVGASGGAVIYTNSARTTGVAITPGGGSWASLSDRNQKNGFADIDPREVLERLVSMHITTWRYNDEVSGAIHMGPMAQDFYERFQLGADDRSITSIDADGVQVAAIQGLYSMVREREVELRHVQTENEKLRLAVEALEAKQADSLRLTVKSLEAKQAENEELRREVGALESRLAKLEAAAGLR